FQSRLRFPLSAAGPRSPTAVTRFGGTSVTMLERTYAHLLESSADAARQRLDAFAVSEKDAEERLGH
ncbi:MAG: hypothetical protein ACRDMW_11040, partial [Gaiellaceae bacterium]